MKKILVSVLVLLSCLSVVSFGSSEVDITIPEFDITVNGVVIDTLHSQYPVIVYNNITYFPKIADYKYYNEVTW